MATRVASMPVQVRTSWFDGSPREITLGERRLSVTRVLGVRDETAAFPAIEGPRTIFEVATASANLVLAYRHRTRRWAVEAFDEVSRAA